MNRRNAVIDTTALISFFTNVFKRPSQISDRAIKLIQDAFQSDSNVLLSIPAIVFIEVFDKWIVTDEFRAMFIAEVLELISQYPNIEIKPIDKEVLQQFISLNTIAPDLENHDKIILASAMMLEWPLITSDEKIIKFVNKSKVIPNIIK